MSEDATLVARARRGDPGAFEALVRRHFGAAFSVALAILGNRMDAEDVCQDGFIAALEKLEGLRRPERFPAWLLQIVRNRARNYRSYRRVRAAIPLDEIEVAGGDDASRAAGRAELARRLETALAELSEVQREIVLLHDMEGWKHREIGEALEMSEGMSRQHLFKARRVLRERLGTEVIKEPADD